jgi:hypothetical protein
MSFMLSVNDAEWYKSALLLDVVMLNVVAPFEKSQLKCSNFKMPFTQKVFLGQKVSLSLPRAISS